jgi:hypothetical protein
MDLAPITVTTKAAKQSAHDLLRPSASLRALATLQKVFGNTAVSSGCSGKGRHPSYSLLSIAFQDVKEIL